MRFSAIICSLALSVGLAVAGPVPDASTPSLSPVGGVKSAPASTPVDPKTQPAPAGGSDVVVVGSSGHTNGVSKRDEYNPLEERASASLILCSGTRCGGACYRTNLASIAFNRCYSAHPYNSLYVDSARGLGYGVYVGHGCRGESYIDLFG